MIDQQHESDATDRRKPIVREPKALLKSRGYSNPELLQIKIELMDKIRAAIQNNGWTHRDVVLRVRKYANAQIAQTDVSRLLNRNVDRFSVVKLMFILAALDEKVSLRGELVADGRGYIIIGT